MPQTRCRILNSIVQNHSQAHRTCQAVGDVDGCCNDEAGDDGGLVAQGQTKDDVSGSASAARIGNILHKAQHTYNQDALVSGLIHL